MKALLDSSHLLLAAFFFLIVGLALAYQIGLLGLAVQRISEFLYACVCRGFFLWRRLLGWAPWPVYLALIVGLHVLAWLGSAASGWTVLAIGLALLFLGIITCLAYVFIDIERYEVGRGYKALHNPGTGQELAIHLVESGPRLGIPSLVVASLAAISGFALLNEGCFRTVGPDWYALKTKAVRPNGVPEEAAPAKAPTYADFLAYTLIHLSRIVDLLDIANTYNIAEVSYVRQARWPASTLLILFKTFFTFVLLQQVFSAIRQFKLLEALQDFWSPHPAIQDRAGRSLGQHGAAAALPLLDSLRSVPFLTVEQRETIPRLLADMGPRVTPILLQHLHDGHENVRVVSVRAVGLLHSLEAVPHLHKLADDSSDLVRESLVKSLETICSVGHTTLHKKWNLHLAQRFSGRWFARLSRFLTVLTRVGRAHPVDEAIGILGKLLEDSSATVRALAAATLGHLGAAASSATEALMARLGDEDESVRCQAADAPSKACPGSAAVAALTPLLQDASAAVRCAAVRALAACKEQAAPAVGHLIPLLQDRDASLRQVAADAIARIGRLETSHLELLAEGLTSPDNLVRAQTAEALGTLGTVAAPAAPALMRALRDNNDEVRVKAAEALGKMGLAAADVMPHMVQGLADEDNRVRALAAEALGEMGAAADQAVPALIQSLAQGNPEVRAMAAGALAKIPSPGQGALTALERATRDPEGLVRAAAVSALATAGGDSPQVATLLVSALEDADPQVRVVAVQALAAQSEASGEVLAALIQKMTDPSDDVKAEAATALSLVAEPTPQVLDGLSHLLEDDTLAVRLSAARALGKLGPAAAAAEPALLQAAQTGPAELREESLRALVRIQSAQAMTAFLGGLRDPEASVRIVASAGLVKMEAIPEDAHAALVAALRDAEPRVRANVAQALAEVDPLPAEAVPVLMEAINHPDDGLRLSAARALRAADAAPLDLFWERLLKDSNAQIRLLAAEAILAKEPEQPEAILMLENLLGDFTVPLRKSTMAVLRALGPAAVRFLDLLRRRLELEKDAAGKAALAGLIESIQKEQAAPNMAAPTVASA